MVVFTFDFPVSLLTATLMRSDKIQANMAMDSQEHHQYLGVLMRSTVRKTSASWKPTVVTLSLLASVVDFVSCTSCDQQIGTSDGDHKALLLIQSKRLTSCRVMSDHTLWCMHGIVAFQTLFTNADEAMVMPKRSWFEAATQIDEIQCTQVQRMVKQCESKATLDNAKLLAQANKKIQPSRRSNRHSGRRDYKQMDQGAERKVANQISAHTVHTVQALVEDATKCKTQAISVMSVGSPVVLSVHQPSSRIGEFCRAYVRWTMVHDEWQVKCFSCGMYT